MGFEGTLAFVSAERKAVQWERCRGGESCARDPFSWDATNKSVRFTVGNVSRLGFWRNWGVWGDRSPRSAIRGRGAGRGIYGSG